MPLATPFGGGEQMLRQLLRHGRGRGIEWIVTYLRDGPMADETRALGIETHVVNAGRFRDVMRRVGAIRRVATLARACRADLVVGWMVAGQLIAGPAAWLAGVPCVWYQVGTPRPDWLDRVATWLPARGVMVLSRHGAAAQARVRPVRRQWLVYPGASLDAFNPDALPTPAELRRRFGLPAHGALIGMVARLQRWKGVHVLVDALPAILAKRPDAHVIVVGGPHETEPGYAAELAARAGALGVAHALRLVGFQSNVPEWMQAMDVIVHASDREPFGIVVIEAMALGKPVVAGNEGGPAEIISDGVDGLLTPFGDAKALAAAVVRLSNERSFAERLGHAARARAAQFDDRRYAEAVIAGLREAASGGAPAAGRA